MANLSTLWVDVLSPGLRKYFNTLAASFENVRSMIHPDAHIVQTCVIFGRQSTFANLSQGLWRRQGFEEESSGGIGKQASSGRSQPQMVQPGKASERCEPRNTIGPPTKAPTAYCYLEFRSSSVNAPKCSIRGNITGAIAAVVFKTPLFECLVAILSISKFCFFLSSQQRPCQ